MRIGMPFAERCGSLPGFRTADAARRSGCEGRSRRAGEGFGSERDEAGRRGLDIRDSGLAGIGRAGVKDNGEVLRAAVTSDGSGLITRCFGSGVRVPIGKTVRLAARSGHGDVTRQRVRHLGHTLQWQADEEKVRHQFADS